MAIMVEQILLTILLMFSGPDPVACFFHPVYTPESIQAATEAPLLEGSWTEMTSGVEPGRVSIVKNEADAYYMTIDVPDQSELSVRFLAVPFRLEKGLYLDLVPLPRNMRHGMQGNLYAPIHYLCYVSVNEASLTLWFMDHTVLARALESNPALLPHETAESLPGVRTVLITANAQAIQAFITSDDQGRNLYMDKVVFKRD